MTSTDPGEDLGIEIGPREFAVTQIPSEKNLMSHRGLVYAANPKQRLIAVTGDRGFTILDLDSGPAEVGDTLSSDDEGLSWFNATRRVRLVAYQRQHGVRPHDLQQCLFSNN